MGSIKKPKWVRDDHWDHFWLGIVISFISFFGLIGLLSDMIRFDEKKVVTMALIFSVIISVVAGYVKEMIDGHTKGKFFDFTDIVATFIGGLSINIVLIFIYLIYNAL